MSTPRMPNLPDIERDLLHAALEIFPRLGAQSTEIRFSDPEGPGSPIVWIAIATFKLGDRVVHETAAALSPGKATFRLLEQLVDGGTCTHCHHPTGITLDIGAQPAAALVCWYQYDPELKVFRRGCQ